MKIVLITTTINVPEVLVRYRQMDPDVFFIVAGDRRTPHGKVRKLISRIGNAVYYSDTDQEKLGYKSSKIIGWNKIMRRNIALLEAIKQKPDIIVTIDDDNLPIGDDYFNNIRAIFSRPYSGVMAVSGDQWFNIGQLLSPPVFHRGFPYEKRQPGTGFSLKPVTARRVGIAAGLWFGDPDIDAMERAVNHPSVLQLSDILHAGIIVDNSHFSPVNSQNTAFLLELAPLMMVLVGVGRYDDIWASYIAERIMMESEYHVHFGQPFVWQERNEQNIWRNLKDEIYGMEYTPQFCRDLLSFRPGEGSMKDKLARLYKHLGRSKYLPGVVTDLGTAWCNDLERTAA